VSARINQFKLVAIGLAFALVACSGLVMAKGSPSKLTAVETPTLIIDPACNTCDGGSVVLQLRNDGSQPEALSLTAGPLFNKATNKSLDAEIILAPVTGLTGKERSENAVVAPGKFQFVRVEVKNVLEEGEWEAEIRNLGAKVGAVKVVRSQVPFSVSLEDADLFLQRCRKGLLLLKDGDAAAYPVTWELLLPGKEPLAGSRSGGKNKAPEEPDLILPARGTTYLAIDPPRHWFPWRSIIKDEVVDSQLILRLRRPNCAAEGCARAPDAPTKILKVKVHLAFVSKGRQEAAQTALVFLFLVIGAGVSFLVNLVLPNQRHRRSVSQLLDKIQLRIDALPTALASRLRVLAGIERSSLAERAGLTAWRRDKAGLTARSPDDAGRQARSLKAWSLDTRDRLAGVQDAAGRLNSRVDLLEKLGSNRARFETLRGKESPPTFIDEIERLFEHTANMLSEIETSKTALIAAQANITEIEKRLASLENKDQSNPEIAKSLAVRALWLGKQFLGDNWETLPNPKISPAGRYETYDRMHQALPGLFDLLPKVPKKGEEIEPRGYTSWDFVVCKLEQIWRYVMWREAGNRVEAKQFTDQQLESLEHKLVRRLLLFSWDGLESARQLVKEMQEGIFPEGIAEQIRLKRVRIRKDRSEIRQFVPTRFYLEFYDPAYDTAKAQEEWTCVWDFDHPAIPGHTQNMLEYGWSASHYFPQAKKYDVKVSFRPHHERHGEQDKQDNQLTVCRTFEVGPPKPAIAKTSWWAEVFQVGVAILPALFALVTGAKDQLFKLDLAPALMAIFLAGFGSDQIKSLLTQQTQASTDFIKGAANDSTRNT